MLLEEHPGHGYDLLGRVDHVGFGRINPGRVYRALRWLVGAGFVHTAWDTTGIGPARRVYEVSEPGRRALEVSASSVPRQLKGLDGKPARYIARRLRALSDTRRTFQFTVDAKLCVWASDQASAHRKLQRTFGEPHVVDADVHTTGAVEIQTPGAQVDPLPDKTSHHR